jgi:trans-L-3-hydroxyproline dehydratase
MDQTLKFKKLRDWTPPNHWLKITTIDVHTEGEPLRIITGGFPELPGDTMLDKRRFAMENFDHLRSALMSEPRGHKEMYGCLITPAVTPGADFGVLFLHNEGFSTMCGHGIIGITKVVLETGMCPSTGAKGVIRIDTPAGLVTAQARITDGHVRSVFFYNVPSFVLALDETVDVPSVGAVRYDVAFGGAFYAYVQAADLGLTCTKEEHNCLVEKGMAIKRAVEASRRIVHPVQKELNFLYGTIFICPPKSQRSHSRNVCIFADGQVDRSPTGTGVSGRLAVHFVRGEIDLKQPIAIESIIGSCFTGRVTQKTTVGGYEAIIPEVEGTAYVTGRHEFFIDPDDPLRNGFIVS